MHNPKIVETCCYHGALKRINREFGSRFPVYLRGIAASRGEPILIPGLTEAGNDARIKNIDDLVEAGTELELSPEGLPLDRPEDIVDGHVIIRVAPYSGRNNVYLMFIPTALRNLARKADERLTPEDHARLALAVLVYDSKAVLLLGGVKIGIPQEPIARKDALLKAYILNNLKCESNN